MRILFPHNHPSGQRWETEAVAEVVTHKDGVRVPVCVHYSKYSGTLIVGMADKKLNTGVWHEMNVGTGWCYPLLRFTCTYKHLLHKQTHGEEYPFLNQMENTCV